MVNANLGPDTDLAKRLADLEGRVSALSTTFGSPPISVSPTANPNYAPNVQASMTGAGSGLFAYQVLWYAYFPYNLPNLSYVVEGFTSGPGNAYFRLSAGPVTSDNAFLDTLIDSWDTVNSDSGPNRYRGYLNMTPHGNWTGGVPGTVSLQGTPSQVGEMWCILLQAAADVGTTVSLQMPMFQTRP